MISGREIRQVADQVCHLLRRLTERSSSVLVFRPR
jgi:hypothetical protein